MAIDGLIILDSAGYVIHVMQIQGVLMRSLRRPIIQSGFHSVPPAYPILHIDALNNALSAASRPDDVDPVLSVPSLTIDAPSACCHAKVADMRLLCPISGDGRLHQYAAVYISYKHAVDPLYAFAFMQTFVDILRDYFGQLSAETLKENFDVVYQVRCLENGSRVSHSFHPRVSCSKKLLTQEVTL